MGTNKFLQTLNLLQCAKTIKITMDEKYGQMGAWQVLSSFTKRFYGPNKLAGGGGGEFWGGHDL